MKAMMFLRSSTFPFKEMSVHPMASMDGVAKTPTTTYIQNSPLAMVKWSHVRYVHQSRTIWGLLYLERLLCVHSKIWWNDRRPSSFFFTCKWMSIKNTGCQVQHVEVTSPTKLGSFCLH
jgi:hypothetical protein